MRCPTLSKLPSPPPDKRGWPWTEESPQLTEKMPDGSPWPKISIVTPSLNQDQFIEETIRSVLLQGYPDLEYIIVDGGSSDDSVEIIKKYAQWLAFWVSEPDKGQSHAINKGFAHARGQVYAYLNSDDVYQPGALNTIAPVFSLEDRTELVAGSCTFYEDRGQEEMCVATWPESMNYFLGPLALAFAQPAAFWNRELFQRVGGFDERLNFCFDREFFLRVGLSGINPRILPNGLAKYRVHQGTKFKTQLTKFYDESIQIVKKHGQSLGLTDREEKVKIGEIIRERSYVEIFVAWKKTGRFSAITKLAKMISCSPRTLLERRVLGLARRLLTYAQSEVMELKKF